MKTATNTGSRNMATAKKAAAGKTGSRATTPRWNLESIYPSVDSQQFKRDKTKYIKKAEALAELVRDRARRRAEPAAWLSECIKEINTVADLYGTMDAYVYCCYSVNTTDARIMRETNELEQIGLIAKSIEVEFRNALSDIRKHVKTLVQHDDFIAKYRFFLEEELTRQAYQMKPELEDLAADLSRAGGEAWSRLQSTLSSNLSREWEPGVRKTVVELRSLAYHPDRDTRRRAYELELAAWKEMQIPLAAALNGVKGATDVINSRRGYTDTLQRSIMQSRISQRCLDALIATMQGSLPVFRGYLTDKARLMGLDKTAFFDLFAPVGAGGRSAGGRREPAAATRWSLDAAADFIVEQFNSFSRELGDFARMAFDEGWLDTEPRAGKTSGAYCTEIPLRRQSRIMANFDGSFNSVSTLAHELGHAYHGWVLRNAPSIHRDYPMTLAETASIFCETIVYERSIELTKAAERIPIVESLLQDATQVIVDILSRFLFERELMAARKAGEVEPERLCALMVDAQKATYGDALDADLLHPFMWAVKGHYYRQDLAFYNFPYAFGQLFGLALFAQYQAEPAVFPRRYRTLLSTTGTADAATVCAGAGFDIETPEFWQSGIDVLARKAAEFTALVDAAVGSAPPR